METVMRIATIATLACLSLAWVRTAGAEDKTAAEAGPAKPGIDLGKIQAQNRLIGERADREHEKAARQYAKAQELIRVDADSNDCLAGHIQRGTCLLTVSAFNRFTSTVEPDGDISEERLKEIRMAILKELLRGDFLADRLAAAGLEKDVAEKGMAEEKAVWAAAMKKIGEGRLRAIYRQYRGFFAAREERTYDVLASTDSARIDSLSRIIDPLQPRAGRSGDSAAPASIAKTGEALAALPWARVADTALPASLSEAGRKLRKWRCSPPLPWEGGFAILRPSDIRKIPQISFEDALPSLVGLIS
jgi:hypothetical protein